MACSPCPVSGCSHPAQKQVLGKETPPTITGYPRLRLAPVQPRWSWAAAILELPSGSGTPGIVAAVDRVGGRGGEERGVPLSREGKGRRNSLPAWGDLIKFPSAAFMVQSAHPDAGSGGCSHPSCASHSSHFASCEILDPFVGTSSLPFLFDLPCGPK